MVLRAGPVAPQKYLAAVLLQGQRPQHGEAIAGNHFPGDLGHHLQVAAGPLGYFAGAKHHDFGGPTAHGHHQPGLEIGLADQAAIKDFLIGGGAGKAAHATGPGQQGHLVEFVGGGQQRGEQGMAHLVVGDQPLLGTVLQGFGAEPHGHPFQGVVHRLLIDGRAVAPGREDRRLVDQVGQVGTGEARGAPRPERQGDVLPQGPTAAMDAEDRLPPAAVGQFHQDLAVETAGAQQGGIQHVGPVSGRQQDHAGVVFKAIHFGEQLVEGLLPFVVAAADASPPLAAHRVDFINKNDARGLGLGLAEQVPHPAGPHPHKQLHKFRGGDCEERHPSLPGDSPGQQGFAGARRTHQQHAPGDFCPHGGETFRFLQEGHHLLEFGLGFVDAGHVVKAHADAAFRLEPRLAAAKAQGPLGHRGGAAQQQHQQTN